MIAITARHHAPMGTESASPVSRVITVTLTATPGCSTRTVAKALGLDESTADYHLRRMRKRGEVVAEPHGRELAWFLNGSGLCPVLKQAVPAVRRPETLATALALRETPATAREVSERAGVPLGSVRWAAGVLEEAGVLVKSPSGRLALRPGADVCIRRAAEGARCELWGRCEVSRALPHKGQGGGAVSAAPRMPSLLRVGKAP